MQAPHKQLSERACCAYLRGSSSSWLADKRHEKKRKHLQGRKGCPNWVLNVWCNLGGSDSGDMGTGNVDGTSYCKCISGEVT